MPPCLVLNGSNPQLSPEAILLLQANALLSSGKPREAIKLYTEILYRKAPGHIIAFLNRSLAYIAERNPELAATDAYRAALCIDELIGPDISKASRRLDQVKDYLRAEENDFYDEEEWLGTEKRVLSTDARCWASSPLASLMMDEDHCPMQPNDEPEYLYTRLNVRAVFRLAAALLDCGGGAVQDALGLISDALHPRAKLTPIERASLSSLGTWAMNGVTNDSNFFKQSTGDGHTVLLPLSPDALTTKITTIPSILYWGDKHEPELRVDETREELRHFTSEASKTCIPLPFDRSKLDLTPGIIMHAQQDHLPGEPLIYERDCWRVTTASPFEILENFDQSAKTDYTRLYCDTCAIAMLMPHRLVRTMLLEAQQPKASTNGSSSASNSKQQEGNPEKRRQIRWCGRTEVSFCDERHQAIYCSKTCRRNRRRFHLGLHENTNIEHQQRTTQIPTQQPPLEGVPWGHPRHLDSHSKTQTIYDLMFIRIYAAAFTEDQNPLELVKWLRVNMAPASAFGGKGPPRWYSPWSFMHNIVRPIWMITRYHAALRQDPLDHLERSDGWVINTLLTKIRSNTQITKGAMSSIIYDIGRECKTYCYRGLEPWISHGEEAVYQSEEDLDEVWVGILDPVTSLVRYADESRGEKPNCWLKYDQGVTVIAGQPDDDLERQGPAIKSGEWLLRPREEFLGGDPYKFKNFTQRTPIPLPPQTTTHEENERDVQALRTYDGTSSPLNSLRPLPQIDDDDDNGKTSSPEISDLLIVDDRSHSISPEALSDSISEPQTGPVSPELPITTRIADSSLSPPAAQEEEDYSAVEEGMIHGEEGKGME
ncbi:MAG: hypothetical protein Q9202_001938 [Teloschistes flavicans]